jgi:lipopolysaccharide biosynthesis glycosyltransferase
MARSLINTINKFHNFPNIIICSDEKNIVSFFPNSNIEFRQFSNKGFNFSYWHPLIWAKLDAFNISTKETIVILDTDIIMYKSLTDCVGKFNKSDKLIGASEDDDCFDTQFTTTNLFKDLRLVYHSDQKALNAGAMLIKPDKSIYKELLTLAKKYDTYAKFPEQAILNMFCTRNNCWLNLGDEFMLLPFSNKIKEVEKLSCLLHFITPRPNFMCDIVQRTNEQSLAQKINSFENLNKYKYPLEKIKSDFEKRLNNKF